MPAVSVIIPNYNHASFLKERIESVLQQDYSDFEVIIIDDCSTDNSNEIIVTYSKHPKVSKIIYNKTNSGSPFLQWKQGLSYASGQWIWIAESDDLAEKNFLSQTIALAHQNKNAAIVYSDALIINADGLLSGYARFSEIKNRDFNTAKWNLSYLKNGVAELKENLALVCTINNASAALLKKDLLQKHISEIARFCFHGDWLTYITLAAQGEIIYSPLTLATVRMHKTSWLNRTSQSAKRKKEYFRILLWLYRNQKEICSATFIHSFTLQYLNFGLRELFRIPFLYLATNFKLGIKIIFHVLSIKRKKEKPKTYFQ